MIIVAPDKFKGSVSAPHLAAVVAAALRNADPSRDVVELPIADGGDGTVDFACRTGMTRVEMLVEGPLGQRVRADYARRGRTAVVEMAAAAGLELLPGGPDRLTAAVASTFGVGQLVAAAIDAGADRVVLGLGGSATTDGGAGMAQALGASVRDLAGRDIGRGGQALSEVCSLDLDPMRRNLAGVDVTLATDVDNPLVGPEGAAAVYGPQKGADADTVGQLDRNLTRWAALLEEETGVDVASLSGAGAAGGAGAPLVASGCAQMRSGIDVLLDSVGFEALVSSAELVVVGEGSLDAQSLRGKGPVGVARRARASGAVVVAVVGTCKLSAEQLQVAGIDRVYTMTDVEPDVSICIRRPDPILRTLAWRMAAFEVGAMR